MMFALFNSLSTHHALCSSSSLSTTPTPQKELYDQIKVKLIEIERLNGVKSLLGWDEMVMLAPGSANARNDQKAAISGVIFEKQTHVQLKDLLENLRKTDLKDLPTDFDRSVVRDAIRDYELTARKSKDMVEREADLEGRGYQAWVTARQASDFSQFSPLLQEIVSLKAEIAAATHPGTGAYDANIDSFERGMKTARLNEIFSVVKRDLCPLIQAITASETFKNYRAPVALAEVPFDVDKQKEMCAEIARLIGFDFDRGRLDVSVHPFTGGSHPSDVRITTRYSATNMLEGVGGTVHEVGHALYEQGRNAEYNDLPVSRALSMGVHESQSLLWERMVFQSEEFWTFILPTINKYFPHTESLTAQECYAFVNRVRPDLIRVQADEVTYPMHIILRFELEQSLFDGSVSVASLPVEWKRKMFESLGVEVSSDAKGPLQDIHWSLGALGYFPSYTLGAMMAAQLFETAEKEIPGLRGKLAVGEFSPLREWLREKIHKAGSKHASLDELLEEVTGRPLDPTVYTNYLKKKYTALYNL